MDTETQTQTFLAETRKHQQRVSFLMTQMAKELLRRGLEHDRSKIESPEEAAVFAEYTAKLKDTTYGSPEYTAALVAMSTGIQRHYRENRHHPEHFELINPTLTPGEGIRLMSMFDLIEMLCDWLAVSERHKDGSMEKSLIHNANRFNISPDLHRVLRLTWDEMKEMEGVCETTT